MLLLNVQNPIFIKFSLVFYKSVTVFARIAEVAGLSNFFCYNKCCLYLSAKQFIIGYVAASCSSQFGLRPIPLAIYSVLVLACFGSFDIKPVDEFADELFEEGETFFVSVFLLYVPLPELFFLFDFNRLYDFFLFHGMLTIF